MFESILDECDEKQRCYFIPSTQAGRNIYIYLDVAGEPQSHELDVVMVEFQFFFHRNIGLCIFVEDVTQQLAQFKNCALGPFGTDSDKRVDIVERNDIAAIGRVEVSETRIEAVVVLLRYVPVPTAYVLFRW